MQARLTMATADALATSPQGTRPTSGKTGTEGAFAGMMLASGMRVDLAERPGHLSGGSPEAPGEAPENEDGVRPASGPAAGGTAIPAGLVPWKALVVNPQTETPAESGEAGQTPGQAADNAADPPPPAKVSVLHALSGDAGFANAGGATVMAATTTPAPPAPPQATLTSPVAADPVDAMVTVTDPMAAGTATPSGLPAGPEEMPTQKAVPMAAGTTTPSGLPAGPEELPAQMAAPAAARPLDVAAVLALKARQLRQQENGGETGKPTYEDPRLARDLPRQGAGKPIRSGAGDALKVAPLVANRAESANPAREAVTVPRDMPDVAAAVTTTGAKEARISPVLPSPVQESGAASPVLADPKAGAAQGTVEASAGGAVRERHERTPAATISAMAAPEDSPRAKDAGGQAAAQHGEHAAPESHVGEKAGSETTAGASRISGVQDRTLARTAAPVFRQVVENLDLQNTGAKVRIQLNPEHLGRVEVSLIARDNTLEVRIMADNPQATQALEGNIHELTEGLKAKAGHYQHLDIHVETRDTVRVKPDDGQPDRRDQQRGQERQGGGRQDGSRDRRQDRSGSSGQSRTWYWPGTKEEA